MADNDMAKPAGSAMPLVPPMDLPFLRAICWQRGDVTDMSAEEMLERYERGWRYVGVLSDLGVEEKTFLHRLAVAHGSWLAGMYDVARHDQILVILNSIDRDFFSDMGIYLGGGTHIALRYGEYRQSRGIDFVCAAEGYRALRERVVKYGAGKIFRCTDDISLEREMRMDQYAMRQAIKLDGVTVELKISRETRFRLGMPECVDLCPVECISLVDCITQKLLANADRWDDETSALRDLIDLAVLRSHRPIPRSAMATADGAYPVRIPLVRALERFQDDLAYRDRCFDALEIHDARRIIDGIRRLADEFRLSPTLRWPRDDSDGSLS